VNTRNERFVLSEYQSGAKQIFRSRKELHEYLESNPGTQVYIVDHQIQVRDSFVSTQKVDYNDQLEKSVMADYEYMKQWRLKNRRTQE
jgi:hypothetical protein